MLRRTILRKLSAEERRLGESLDYVRHIVNTSLPAFFRFAKIFPIAAYRKRLPTPAKHVAQIVAARDEDCGTCVQIAINMAKAEGVPTEILRSVVECQPAELSLDLQRVYRFTEAVVRAEEDPAELRAELTQSYGPAAVVELGLAIASSRFFPIMKRSLGYATSCSVALPQI